MLRKIRKMLKHQEGFTLVELMIVVVILGILAGVGIQQYGRVQTSAKASAHNANIKIITSAANMYLMANDSVSQDFDVEDLVVAGYLDAVPRNPFGDTGASPAGEYELVIEEHDTNEGFWDISVNPGPVDDKGALINPETTSGD